MLIHKKNNEHCGFISLLLVIRRRKVDLFLNFDMIVRMRDDREKYQTKISEHKESVIART